MLIYGAPGSGKTTFATSHPHSFVISTEPGTQFQKAADRRVERWAPDPSGKDRRLDFVRMVEGVRMARQSGKLKTMGYNTVILDTISGLYDLCVAYVCEKNGVQDLGEVNNFGLFFREARKTFLDKIAELQAAANVIMICHEEIDGKEVESLSGVKKEVSARIPLLDKKIFAKLNNEIRIIGYAKKTSDGKYVLDFRSKADLETKDRTAIFDQIGTLHQNKWVDVKTAWEKKVRELGFKLPGDK